MGPCGPWELVRYADAQVSLQPCGIRSSGVGLRARVVTSPPRGAGAPEVWEPWQWTEYLFLYIDLFNSPGLYFFLIYFKL